MCSFEGGSLALVEGIDERGVIMGILLELSVTDTWEGWSSRNVHVGETLYDFCFLSKLEIAIITLCPSQDSKESANLIGLIRLEGDWVSRLSALMSSNIVLRSTLRFVRSRGDMNPLNRHYHSVLQILVAPGHWRSMWLFDIYHWYRLFEPTVNFIVRGE